MWTAWASPMAGPATMRLLTPSAFTQTQYERSFPAQLLYSPIGQETSNKDIASSAKKIDVLSEVGMLVETLRACRVASGALVVVSAAGGLSRLARVAAIHPAHPAAQLYPATDVAADALNAAESLMAWAGSTPKPHQPAHNRSPSTQASRFQPNVVYLPPGMAHNLGLELGLAPLVGAASEAASEAASVAASVATVRVAAYLPPPSSPGLVAAPSATLLQLAVIRTPEEMDDSDTDEEAGDRDDDMADAAADVAAEQDDVDSLQSRLERALRLHFRVPRLLATGDVFAVALPSQTQQPLRWPALSPPRSEVPMEALEAAASVPAPDVVFLQVQTVCTTPRGDGACVSDEHLAHRSASVAAASCRVVLEGSVAARVPWGLAEFARRCCPSPSTSAQEAATEHAGLGALSGSSAALGRVLAARLHRVAAPLRATLAVLLVGPPGSGKRRCVAEAAEAVGCQVVTFNCRRHAGAGPPDAPLKAAFEAASRYSPCALVLRHLDAVAPAHHLHLSKVVLECVSKGQLPDRAADPAQSYARDHVYPPSAATPYPSVILMASVTSAAELSAPLRRCFTHEIIMELPNRSERECILRSHLEDPFRDSSATLANSQPASALLDFSALAADTAGCTSREVRTLAAAALAHSIAQSPTTLRESAVAQEDVDAALRQVKSKQARLLGAPQVPRVRWDDVGGLEEVKRGILDTVQLPLQHKSMFASGLRRRSGVLLYGPPGTGKTLLAKAVATECSLNFLSVKGPELINMYIGESERNVREVFERARRAKPCVVFLDELDALAPARGVGGDSGGVMDRVVSQLLAELDGLQGGEPELFVIGASNRPDLIDPALLRPGRFDRLLYVGISSDTVGRAGVLKALTNKFALHDNVDLVKVASQCPLQATGADLYALCASAWLKAVRRRLEDNTFTRREDSSSVSMDADDRKVVVTHADLMTSALELRPSLSEAEVLKYEQLRTQYEAS